MTILYLQDDPVAFLSCHFQGLFSDDLLALTQRHVVEVLVVESVAQLLPWRKTTQVTFQNAQANKAYAQIWYFVNEKKSFFDRVKRQTSRSVNVITVWVNSGSSEVEPTMIHN